MKRYAYEFKEMSTVFNDMIFCHSLSGGYSYLSKDKMYDAIMNMDSKWEICTTYERQPMGDIGLYVQGTVLVASNTDLNSFCDETKHRYFDDNFADIVTSVDEMDIKSFANSEVIVTDYVKVGLWVDADYYMDNSEFVEDLAKKSNLKLSIVEKQIQAGAWMFDDDDEEDWWN